MTGARKEMSGGEVTGYRAGVARLLGKAIGVTEEIEQLLGVTIGTGGWEATPARAGLENDPDRRLSNHMRPPAAQGSATHGCCPACQPDRQSALTRCADAPGS